MRVGFHDPYLDALGGGEKYLLSILEEVTRGDGAPPLLLSPSRPDPTDWRRLGIALEPDDFAWTPVVDPDAVTEASRDLDLLVAMTNDIPPLAHAGRSVAVVQFPFRRRDAPLQRLRAAALGAVGRSRAPAALASYDGFVCYSEFTRAWTVRRLGVEAEVIAPPVDLPTSSPVAKGPLILSVGRFFPGYHDKKHGALIEAFRTLDAPGWELHLVGGVDGRPETRRHLEALRAAADGLAVSFHVDAPLEELRDLYARASLYWHAAGLGEDADRHPERMEHFGIATAEAMAHGAVPLVVPGGGQAEIVSDGVTGLHWGTPAELVGATRALIDDPARREALGASAARAAGAYDKERFLAAVRERVLRGG